MSTEAQSCRGPARPKRRHHVGLDLRLRQRATVDADVVDRPMNS